MTLEEKDRLEALRSERTALARRTPGDIVIIVVRILLALLIVKATMNTEHLWAFAAFAFASVGIFGSFVVPLFRSDSPRERIREVDRELATLTGPRG